MKNGIIAYLPHKYRANARDKKIIFFAIMKPLKADNAKQNRQPKHKKFAIMKPLKADNAKQNRQPKHKKGAYCYGKHKQSEREI
ncbi:hypothetical protein HpDR42_02820 [Helicobacter pylori]